MASPLPPAPSRDDPDGIDLLRKALDAAVFTTEEVAEAIGAGGPALTPTPTQVPALLRMLGGDTRPLATLVRLFVASVPVGAGEAEAALEPLPLGRAAALGVLRVDGEVVRPLVRIVPAGDVWIASDLLEDLARLPPDIVMGIAPSSWALANLTVRVDAGSALDVGTGCGVQALFAAGHSERVVATDSNPRAVAFTRFSAALNGLPSVEVVEGDLFDPLAGHAPFDLIVANPPYVIGPDAEYVYRDSGRGRDDLSRSVVEGAAGLLAEGGYGHVLVSWVHEPGGDWSAPLREWVDGLGCDAWLLHFTSYDAEEYAVTWNLPLAGDPARQSAAIGRWLDYFAGEEIAMIGWGAVVLRRRSGGGPPWVRAESLGAPPAGVAGEDVWRLFAARDYLDDVGGRQGLLGERLVLDPAHRLEQVLRLRNGELGVERAVLHLERELPMRAAVDGFATELLGRLDGSRVLAEAVDEAGARFAPGADPAVVRWQALERIERLLELGFLSPVVPE